MNNERLETLKVISVLLFMVIVTGLGNHYIDGIY